MAALEPTIQDGGCEPTVFIVARRLRAAAGQYGGSRADYTTRRLEPIVFNVTRRLRAAGQYGGSQPTIQHGGLRPIVIHVARRLRAAGQYGGGCSAD